MGRLLTYIKISKLDLHIEHLILIVHIISFSYTSFFDNPKSYK